MRAIILLFPVVVGACAVPAAHQGALNSATAACSQGDRNACAQLPALNSEVQQENANNAVATGVAAALGGAVLGAAAAAPYGYPYGYAHPYYYRHYYRHCWGWHCW